MIEGSIEMGIVSRLGDLGDRGVGGEAVILKVLVGITQCTTSLNGIGVLANPHLRGLSYNSHNTTQHTTQTTQ